MLQRRVQFVLCHGHADVPGRLDEAGYPMVRLSGDVLLPVSAPDATGQPLHAIGRACPLAVLVYSEASGLGRIMRARMKGVFSDAASADFPQGIAVVFTAHHAVLLKTMALEGRGLAWLPQSLIAGELKDGRLVAAGNAAWQVPVDIRLYRQHVEMAPAAEALWKLAGA